MLYNRNIQRKWGQAAMTQQFLQDVEEDKKSKRQKILEAAYVVFSQKGFHKATVDDIIALADTGKGTVYNYFTNKEQLFFTLLEERGQACREKVGQIVASSAEPLQKIEQLVRVQLQFFAENTALWRIMMHELRALGRCSITDLKEEQQAKYRERYEERVVKFRQVIEEGQQIGVIKYPDAERAAFMLFSIIIGTALGTNGEYDIEDRVKSITELFFHGVTH
jgi:AcrR family transcriptional regulator